MGGGGFHHKYEFLLCSEYFREKKILSRRGKFSARFFTLEVVEKILVKIFQLIFHHRIPEKAREQNLRKFSTRFFPA